MTEKVLVFDTTLRDGEQSPGASMPISEKMMLAHQLERLHYRAIQNLYYNPKIYYKMLSLARSWVQSLHNVQGSLWCLTPKPEVPQM
jgi:hypothetical protein